MSLLGPGVAALGILKKAAVAVPLAWTGAWLTYYAYTDTVRRGHIRRRLRILDKEYARIFGEVEHREQGAVVSQAEKEALKKRFASLKFAGRYWNPYVEWREQGAWEWALWKMVISTLTLKMFHNNGVPKGRPIKDLPVEKPNFDLLFPASTSRKDIKQVEGMSEKARGKQREEVTDKFTITWLGQSTSYVTMEGLAVLTDPALQDRTIESVLAPRRLRPPPCQLSDLRTIDIVLVSHNHYDHLDPPAIMELGDACLWVVPTGVGAFFRKYGVTRVVELDWWEDMDYDLQLENGEVKRFKVTAVPLMHWSARSPADTNASLWSGYHIQTISSANSPSNASSRTFLHVGDTGYSPTLFDAIGKVLGPIDLAAIPIGAYEPRWHLHLQHTDPDGAVRIFKQLNVKKAIGVHWGTWLMSDEAYNQPPKDLAIAREKHELKEDQFNVVPVGRTLTIPLE